jgi:geranylgeranyl diphosphate synthase type 3
MNTIDRNYIPLANLLGIYYQIRDDYMNLQSVKVS